MQKFFRISLCLAAVFILTGCGQNQQQTGGLKTILRYERPSDATEKIEGKKLPFALWYNPNLWSIWKTPGESTEETAEWSLILLDPKDKAKQNGETAIRAETNIYVYADKNLKDEEFKSFIQKRIFNKARLEKFVEISSDQRLVNQLKVLAWNFRFKYAEAAELTALIYFYSDDAGSIALVSFTPSKDWDKSHEAMLQLLNGFTLSDKKDKEGEVPPQKS